MASRRTRIKGIANIPPRKKPIKAEIIVKDDEQEQQQSSSTFTEIVEENSINPVDEIKIAEITQPIIAELKPEADLIIEESQNSCTEAEYPLPPQSPNKYNRNRIKPIPRLQNQRKLPSNSDCEIIEENRNNKLNTRIRNNSVCSVASSSTTTTTTFYPEEIISPNNNNNSTTMPQQQQQQQIDYLTLSASPKKQHRTEQSRKLAEARREFHKKFDTNHPDKQQLKMIDLIFYNPLTNPMSNSENKPISQTTVQEEEEEATENEAIDEPQQQQEEEEEEIHAENDDALPVPQIKIGPSGEIILDEQSLVVENSELVKQKAKLENSQLIDGDFPSGYGVYKRVPRTPNWTQKETLQFYKALNLIGTDFTAMTKLFPKRNRRELKMKFKKEEKINRQLIDRAITQPCKYNFQELNREFALEREEEEFLLKLKQDELEQMKLTRENKKQQRKRTKKNCDTDNDKDNKDSTVVVAVKRKKSSLNIINVILEEQEEEEEEDEENNEQIKKNAAAAVAEHESKLEIVEELIKNAHCEVINEE